MLRYIILLTSVTGGRGIDLPLQAELSLQVELNMVVSIVLELSFFLPFSQTLGQLLFLSAGLTLTFIQLDVLHIHIDMSCDVRGLEPALPSHVHGLEMTFCSIY